MCSMKIGIVSDAADRRSTGPGNIMYNLVRSVADASPHEVVWIHAREAESDLADHVPDMKVPSSIRKSAAEIKDGDFDVIHMDCISSREMLLYPFLLDTTFIATQFGDVQWAEKDIWPHSTIERLKKRWGQRVLHRYYDAITVSSESAKNNFVEAGFPEEKFTVVNPALDQGYRDAEPLPLGEREDVMLHVSNFQPIRKNPALLIEAFEQVRAVGHDVDLKIAGGRWHEGFIVEHTDDPETREHIELLGHIPNQELKELYRTSRAFLVPTRHEGFPIPPMESMAYGTPVVSNNVYAVPETVGDAGILIDDPDDVDGFASAVISLLEDDEYWTELSEKSIERVAGMRWGDSAEKIAAIYDSLEL